jgi:hypothetical protein
MMTPLLLPRLLAALLACTSVAAAHHVHILDAGPAPPPPSAPAAAVSPPTARLIFASRLGLASRFAVGDGIDDAGLAAISALGGFPSKPAFAAGGSSTGEQHVQRGLVVVRGAQVPEDVLPKDRSGWRGFDVGPMPHPDGIEELLGELDGAMKNVAKGEIGGVGRVDLKGQHGNWVRRVNGRSVSYSVSLEVSLL